MLLRVLLLAPIAALAASTASAQYRAEISGFAGYTFADGVTFPGVEVPETGQIFNTIEPTNAFSWGAELSFFITENAQAGAVFDRHQSSLRVLGPASRLEVADMNVDNYHAVFTYNFGDDYASARPYVQGGIGATRYSSFSVEDREIDGETRFSTTWGAGIKIYPADVFGVRLGVRWTPTYIRSDPAGWWCDPFWGCYVASNAQFSNQFEFSGGLSLRF
jgi:opacity protein-like surface antigen